MKYRPKTTIAQISDKLLRFAFTMTLGIGWFIYLWGLCLPALTAGFSLGILLWLCSRQFAKHMTQKHEKQMRQQIGGELACERLLLERPEKAVRQCALWLQQRYPFTIEKTEPWGAIGTLNGSKACLQLLAVHPSGTITAQHILQCVREAALRQIELVCICTTAPAAKEALHYASTLETDIRIISREELIVLAGHTHPASDEDLRMIGKRAKPRQSLREWLAVVLDRSRTGRYFWYGAGLCMFALFTGIRYYIVPGILCLVLFACSKLQAFNADRRKRWQA